MLGKCVFKFEISECQLLIFKQSAHVTRAHSLQISLLIPQIILNLFTYFIAKWADDSNVFEMAPLFFIAVAIASYIFITLRAWHKIDQPICCNWR